MSTLKGRFLRYTKSIGNELIGLPSTKAVVMYGSVIYGKVDEHSDIDLLWLGDSIASKESRERLHKKLGSEVFELLRDFEAFWYKGIWSSIVYRTVSSFDDKIKKLIDSKEDGEAEGEIAVFLHRCKPLYDPDGIVKEWREKIREYPEYLAREKVKSLSSVLHQIKHIKIGLGRYNLPWVDLSMNKCIESIIVALYGLNREYYPVVPKWFFRDAKKFRKMPKNCLDNMEQIVELNNTDEIGEKTDLLFKVFLDVYGLCKEEFPGFRLHKIEKFREDVKEIEDLARKKFFLD